MTTTPTVGQDFPHGRQLAAAVTAGVLWLVALRWLVDVPRLVREAFFYRERTGEGVLFAQVGFQLLAVSGALLLAQRLSVTGHGDAATAPSLVWWTRFVTWGVLMAMWVAAWVAALVIPGTLDGSCLRTCALFPK